MALGAAPLLAIIAVAKLGLLSDPNPNPIGPGLFFAATFPPSAVLIAVGAIQWLRRM